MDIKESAKLPALVKILSSRSVKEMASMVRLFLLRLQEKRVSANAVGYQYFGYRAGKPNSFAPIAAESPGGIAILTL